MTPMKWLQQLPSTPRDFLQCDDNQGNVECNAFVEQILINNPFFKFGDEVEGDGHVAPKYWFIGGVGIAHVVGEFTCCFACFKKHADAVEAMLKETQHDEAMATGDLRL